MSAQEWRHDVEYLRRIVKAYRHYTRGTLRAMARECRSKGTSLRAIRWALLNSICTTAQRLLERRATR
jgi:predicted phage tail protein